MYRKKKKNDPFMTSIRSKSLFDIYLKFKKNRGEKKKEKKKYEATLRSKGDGRKIGLDTIGDR